VEVVGPKPSIGPSDKERLAAGISTIRLQTPTHSREHNGRSLKLRKLRKELRRLKNLQERLLHLKRRWRREVMRA
jgi:hypothetical protein